MITGALQSCGATCVIDQTLALQSVLVRAAEEVASQLSLSGQTIPIMSSECPGVVVFAEKTQTAEVVNRLSTVRSPQQLLGAMIKTLVSSNPLVMSLQPCFDKKLEASRHQFARSAPSNRSYSSVSGSSGENCAPEDCTCGGDAESSADSDHQIPDVDCVISTIELDRVITEKFGSLLNAPRATSLHSSFIVGSQGPLRMSCMYNNSSGGYAQHIARLLSLRLWNQDLETPLEFQPVGRNSDFLSASVHPPPNVEGARPLTFALCYGLRAMHALFNSVKRGTARYDYVEVMACPSGCVNGGAQMRPQIEELQSTDASAASMATRQVQKAWLNELLTMMPTSQDSWRTGSPRDLQSSLMELWYSLDPAAKPSPLDDAQSSALLYIKYQPMVRSESASLKW